MWQRQEVQEVSRRSRVARVGAATVGPGVTAKLRNVDPAGALDDGTLNANDAQCVRGTQLEPRHARRCITAADLWFGLPRYSSSIGSRSAMPIVGRIHSSSGNSLRWTSSRVRAGTGAVRLRRAVKAICEGRARKSCTCRTPTNELPGEKHTLDLRGGLTSQHGFGFDRYVRSRDGHVHPRRATQVDQ